MINGIRVISPGLYTSIQDGGRFGYRHLGVPVSGPLDSDSFTLANILLQNERNAPVLEMIGSGQKIEFLTPVRFALTGADFSPEMNHRAIRHNCVFRAGQGDILTLKDIKAGNIAYLGVEGGWREERVLGSCSQLAGITIYPRVLKDQVVQCGQCSLAYDDQIGARVSSATTWLADEAIEVMKGPEFDRMPPKALTKVFTLSPSSNRMAYQFEEAVAIAKGQENILTSAVMPGTVQLTPAGGLVALMRDCQTTGGYPRALQLPDRSINQLAQKRAGETVRFVLLD